MKNLLIIFLLVANSATADNYFFAITNDVTANHMFNYVNQSTNMSKTPKDYLEVSTGIIAIVVGTLTASEQDIVYESASNYPPFLLKDTNQVPDEVVLSNAIHGLQVEIERSVTNNAPFNKGFLKSLRADWNTYLQDGGTTLAEWKKAMRKGVRTESLKAEFINNWGRDSLVGIANFGAQNEEE